MPDDDHHGWGHDVGADLPCDVGHVARGHHGPEKDASPRSSRQPAIKEQEEEPVADARV
jgi:hypothetical protein